MHDATFLSDLAIVMIVAGLVTIVFHRLKQPVVLGYIIAGVIIGPHTPPFPLIRDEETIRTLSELGIIFLMFSLGLEFSLRKLREVGATAFIAAITGDSCHGVRRLLARPGVRLEHHGQHFSRRDPFHFFDHDHHQGARRTRAEKGTLRRAHLRHPDRRGHPRDRDDCASLGLRHDRLVHGVRRLAGPFCKLGSFLGVLLVAGLIVVPRLLNYVARFKSNEMLLVAVLGLCFGVSLLAVKLGYSVALGAFLIGAIIAEARQIARIETLLEPVRDMFSAVFFVSIGLLIDPRCSLEYAGPIVVITAVVVIGQVIVLHAWDVSRRARRQTALRVGMGLAQIGEFSFIIAVARTELESDERVPLSDRGRGFRSDDADHALSVAQLGAAWSVGSIARFRRRSGPGSTFTRAGWRDCGRKAVSRWAWSANGPGRSRLTSSWSPAFLSAPRRCAATACMVAGHSAR